MRRSIFEYKMFAFFTCKKARSLAFNQSEGEKILPSEFIQ